MLTSLVQWAFQRKIYQIHISMRVAWRRRDGFRDRLQAVLLWLLCVLPNMGFTLGRPIQEEEELQQAVFIVTGSLLGPKILLIRPKLRFALPTM